MNADTDGANAGNGSTSGVVLITQSLGSGTGFQGTTISLDTEFEIVTLPEAFEFFGQSFTHICQRKRFLDFWKWGKLL